MTQFLIGLVIGIIAGAFLGAYLVTKFDVTNISYAIEKLRAKKGATINVEQENLSEKKEKINNKRRFFDKLKNRRTRK